MSENRYFAILFFINSANNIYLIHGLDADLILLSLMSDKADNIYLMREQDNKITYIISCHGSAKTSGDNIIWFQRDISYFKKIITPNDDELIKHEQYLKDFLKKNNF